MSPGRPIAVLALLLVACGSRAVAPPHVRWGVDECSHCHMILSEPRYAAVARSATGDEARFDDLGCLLRWASTDRSGWQIWVHDSAGDEWLDAEAASFTHSATARTPMGSGWQAWGSPASATAARHPLSWSELRRAPGHSPAGRP